MFRRIPLVLSVVFPLLAVACDPKPTENPDQAQPEDEEIGSLAKDAVEEAGALVLRGQPQKGLEVADEALKDDPDNHELHYVRGAALQELGRGEEAIGAFERAAELKPDFAAAVDAVGSVHLDAKRVDEARAAFERAISIDPEFANAHFNLGLLLARTGDAAKAMESLQRAHELEPTDADTLLEMAALQERGGDLDAAKATLAKAVEVAPKDAFVRMVNGDVLRAGGDKEGSLKEYAAAVELDGNLADARLRLIRALRRAGRSEEALTHASKLVEQLPDNAIAWSDYGGTLVDLDRTDDALAALDKALGMESQLVSAHRRKIEALSKAGRCADAKAALKTFEGQKPDKKLVEPAAKLVKSCKKK